MLEKISVLLLVLCFLCLFMILPASAKSKKEITFDKKGNFRILQINDFQDIDTPNKKSMQFLNAVLDQYKPDLVVFVGDQIRDGLPGATVEMIKKAISNQIIPVQERGIPFLFTFGNHDREYKDTMPMEEQAEYYRSYSCCYANTDGTDGGTYHTVIYASDGVTPALNIYMMDTNDWNERGDISGVTPAQVEWYVKTSNALKEQNGGKVLPSLVFQHIPVKEIHKLLTEVPQDTEGAIKGRFGDKHYVINPERSIGDCDVIREAPSSEPPEKITGQYEAWVQQGDIIGAYFGHDHINTFVGKTEDGVVLGYNGGFGFAGYGEPGERYARIYDFNENDIENYTQKTIYYTETVENLHMSQELSPTADNCSCDCHKNGFVGFTWKILSFFHRIFGVHSVCECGIKHY